MGSLNAFELGYYVLSQSMYWYTIGHSIGASILLCTIPKSELGYCIPSQGMYWYILGQNPGPWPRIRAFTDWFPLATSWLVGV